MKPQIKVLDSVVQRLKTLDQPCSGKLFGIFAKNTFFILGLQLENDNGVNLSYSLPAEVDFCGIFEAYADPYDTQKVLTRCSNIEVTDNPIFVSIKLTIQNEIQSYVVCNNQINNTNYAVVTKQAVYSQFVHVRLRGEFQLSSEQNELNITNSFAGLRKSIASGIMAFVISKLNVILVTSDSESGIIGLTGDPVFGDICQDANEEGSQRKKKNDQPLELEVIDMNIIKKVTRDGFNGEIKSHSPVVVLDKKHFNLLNIPIKIDFLAMVNKDTKLSKGYDILLESAIKNLKLYENVLHKYLNHCLVNKSVDLPDTLHFFPRECGHFLTRIIFRNSEDNLRKDRELMHNALLLTKNLPTFRKSNQFQFPDPSKSNGPLLNVHEGVKLTNNGGKVSLVKGNYEYYHYCQNRMDDNGWGCAYRSLQTLASWFKLQGYTDCEVPTFKDIQKCLVEIGDKPSSFIDSTQWIGSTEVNYVLDSLLGVTSKILFVSSGEEMGAKGSELFHHFETQGSPVMIGGGVLAHTILGVDYNQQTGGLKFLILDPHYTGGEDLHIIQSKGWCGWKGVDFWDKASYYNMCLPQVPREV